MAENNNSIKNWLNKTIKDIGDSINESQIENAYDESHDHFLIYQYSNNIFETAKSVYGEFSPNELVLTYYGKEEFDLYSIVVNEKTNEVFFSVKYLDDTSIEVNYNNTKYIRTAKRLLLSREVREVKVVKVKDKYYIYEKPENN
ncbi:MAG: hypothetical protein PUJ85_04295 [bacterium]|nr:hypothetical protein [bacterium]